MIPRLSLIASATLAWALSNPIPDPVILVLSARWGVGVHGSDLLPLLLIVGLWCRSYVETRRRQRAELDDWLERMTPRETTYQPYEREWLS